MSRTTTLSASAAVLTARVFSLVCAVVQLPLLTAALSPAEFAGVAIAMALATYFSLVAGDPTVLSFQRFPGSMTDRRNYRFTMGRIFILTCFVAAIVLCAGLLLGQAQICFAAAGWGFGLIVNRLTSTAWLMWRVPWLYSANLMLTVTVRTATLVLLVILEWDPTIAVALSGLATGVSALLISPRFRSAPKLAQPPWTWAFGIHLGVSSLAITALSTAALLLSPLLIDRNEVGQFAAMSQVVTYSAGALFGLINTVAFPPLRADWDNGLTENVLRRIGELHLAFIGLSGATLAIISVADFFPLSVFLGESFIRPELLGLLILGNAAAAIGTTSSWRYQFRLKVKSLSQRSYISAALGAILTIVGASFYHIEGVALGFAGGYLVYCILQSRGGKRSFALQLLCALLATASLAALYIPSEILAPFFFAVGVTIAAGALLAYRLTPSKRVNMSSS